MLALVALLVLPSLARADGDPGSDVLLEQNLFAGSDAGLSTAEQLRLGDLLSATAAAGAPVRVAIIAHPDDLGTITPLWGRPQAYAQYLGTELSLTYPGRLLIVMPSGYGVWWAAHRADLNALAKTISGLHVAGDSAADLVAATSAAVTRIEAEAGVSARELAAKERAAGASAATVGATAAAASGSAASAIPIANRATGTTHQSRPTLLFLAALILILVVYVALRRGWRPRRSTTGWWPYGLGVRRWALLPAALLLVVAGALVINHQGSSSGQAVSDLASNPDIDSGTSLPGRPAPGFTLTDESGHQISLKQYRGKVVILSFVDAECQTLCPLTTEAMLDAKASLGAAGKDVQLLGIDANWKSTQVEDVLNYTQLHGLLGQWHFLTGSLKQLEKVWTDYGVNERALISTDSNVIDHVAATYVIDPNGRLRDVLTTYPSYAAVPQFGQVMAQDAARLLPSHPKLSTDYSYAEVRGITPSQRVTLPRSGGGSVKLGPGKAHLYLFFATWDQTTGIGAELSELNAYQRDAANEGLPSLTAIDEGSVEPSPDALPAFLQTLPHPLTYPVGIDTTGRVADGYEVQGDPWFVLTNAAGQIKWYQEVYTNGWPTQVELEEAVRAALAPKQRAATAASLIGSPASLAALHAQASKLLSGGPQSLRARIKALHGYPIVLNIWGSWCTPCQKEFGLFGNASLQYGRKVAFLGADVNDEPGNAQAFLDKHHVSYPSYGTTPEALDWLLPGGLQGTPTTVYISPSGKVLDVHVGQYDSQGTLDADIEGYALGNAG